MPKINMDIMFKNISKDWFGVFMSNKIGPLLIEVVNQLESLPTLKTLAPPIEDIFNFARKTKYGNIVGMIIGQDPYPGKGDADGLCFSSKNKHIPASLNNIYKCLLHTKQIHSKPTISDLTQWAEQGLLMINTALTTEEGKTKAHVKIWENFVNALILYITHDDKCSPCPSIAVMLWGTHAQSKIPFINEYCVIMKWRHPSPLAQACDEKERFINCTHFADLNQWLDEEVGDVPLIDWNPDPVRIMYTDGSCNNKPNTIYAQAGYSVYFNKGSNEGTVKYGKVPTVILNGKIKYGTPPRGEGLALVVALESVNNLSPRVTIFTDSQFWIDMIYKYMPAWDRRGVDFKEKANHDITTKLFKLVNDIEQKGTLNIIHVSGHSGNAGNDIADMYAKKGKTLNNFDMQTSKV
jgi:uracil-DNA glycosylase